MYQSHVAQSYPALSFVAEKYKLKQGVGLPRKYLGHGICDARSKLLNLRRATADAGTLKLHALQLLRESKVPPGMIRGIGLQMTRLGPSTGGDGDDDGGGGGGGSGAGVDGRKAGSSGALHGWLVKPNGSDEEKEENEKEEATDEDGRLAYSPTVVSTESTKPTKSANFTWKPIKSTASTTPAKSTVSTAVEQAATPRSMPQGLVVAGGVSSPSTADKALGEELEFPVRFVHPPVLSGEDAGVADPSGEDGLSGLGVFQGRPRQQTFHVAEKATAACSSSSSGGSPLNGKRLRGEGDDGDDGGRPSPPHENGPDTGRSGDAAVAPEFTFLSKPAPMGGARSGGANEASVDAEAGAQGEVQAEAEIEAEAGARAVVSRGRRVESSDSPPARRKQKVSRTSGPGTSSSLIRSGDATPLKSSAQQAGETNHAQAGASHDSREGTGGSTPFSSAGRGRGEEPGSPEWLSPPTPAERVIETPPSGAAAGNPSMSQVRKPTSCLISQQTCCFLHTKYRALHRHPPCTRGCRCT